MIYVIRHLMAEGMALPRPSGPHSIPGCTCGRSFRFCTLYHMHPSFEHLFLSCDLFALLPLRVNLMWTFHEGDG